MATDHHVLGDRNSCPVSPSYHRSLRMYVSRPGAISQLIKFERSRPVYHTLLPIKICLMYEAFLEKVRLIGKSDRDRTRSAIIISRSKNDPGVTVCSIVFLAKAMRFAMLFIKLFAWDYFDQTDTKCHCVISVLKTIRTTKILIEFRVSLCFTTHVVH